LGRKTALHIHGPKGIKEAITLLLKLGDSWTDYPLVFHELVSKEREVVFEDGKVRIETIPLDHRVYTNGFLFREMESPSRKLNMETVKQYNIETCYYQLIKNGKDMVLENGTVITNQELTLDPPRPKSYAFCSDTAYLPTMVPQIREVDVLYHESTFLESETDKATQTKHTTAREAATIALAAGVGLLILGHYSTRYGSLELFKKEALQVFPNVELAEDGRVFHFH
jgi:ribonuclease Z